MDLFLLVLVLAVGFVMGYLSKGVTITINKQADIPLDEEGQPKYNESLADDLPLEVQQYYHNNKGQNNF